MTTLSVDKKAIIGVIGLGIMGSSFALNLLSRGYNVHVYNRTKEKAQPLVEKGATFHSTPRDLASVADVRQDFIDWIRLWWEARNWLQKESLLFLLGETTKFLRNMRTFSKNLAKA